MRGYDCVFLIMDGYALLFAPFASHTMWRLQWRRTSKQSGTQCRTVRQSRLSHRLLGNPLLTRILYYRCKAQMRC